MGRRGVQLGKTPTLNRNGWLRAPMLAATAGKPASIGGRVVYGGLKSWIGSGGATIATLASSGRPALALVGGLPHKHHAQPRHQIALFAKSARADMHGGPWLHPHFRPGVRYVPFEYLLR
eukprot:COSAG02_NODE_2783_length_8036_cov_41.488976_11_plen_120_part_00